jgi:precorrin-6B methylase 2
MAAGRGALSMRFTAGLLAFASFVACAQEGEQRAPFVTTPSDVVMRMLRLAGTGPADLVADLGSGDGRIVIAAAREFGAHGLGIELDPRLVETSRENAKAAAVADRAAFVHGDALLADISKASVVTVYLLPHLMDRLQPRFLEELHPGTRIVSHAFAMTGWKPDRAETMRLPGRHPGQGDESTLYLWVVPAATRGKWQGGEWRLQVEQNFQEIEVDGTRGGRTVPITGARLSGRDISWEADGARFRGRVEGERIVGELGSAPLVLQRLP